MSSLTQALTIVGIVAGGPTLSTPSSVPAGGQVPVTFTNAPGNDTDWIALGTPGGSYGPYVYLHGERNGVVNLPASTNPGTYEARLYPNNGGIVTATSPPFTVTTPRMTIVLTPSNPVIQPGVPTLTYVSSIHVVSDVGEFTGTVGFGPPNYDAGGLFAIQTYDSTHQDLVVNGALLDGVTYHVTIEAR